MSKTPICLCLAAMVFFLSGCSSSSKEEQLIEAVKNGETAKVKTLLDEDADSNTTDEDGMTALQLSIKGHHIEITKLMLDRGAEFARNPESKNVGARELNLAARYTYGATIPMLLAAGAEVDARYEGNTALMTATNWNNSFGVKILIEAGADVMLRDDDGDMPIFHAGKIGPEAKESFHYLWDAMVGRLEKMLLEGHPEEARAIIRDIVKTDRSLTPGFYLFRLRLSDELAALINDAFVEAVSQRREQKKQEN